MTSRPAASRDTMRGSADDVELCNVPRHNVRDSADEVEPSDVHPAKSSDTAKNSADDIDPQNPTADSGDDVVHDVVSRHDGRLRR